MEELLAGHEGDVALCCGIIGEGFLEDVALEKREGNPGQRLE